MPHKQIARFREKAAHVEYRVRTRGAVTTMIMACTKCGATEDAAPGPVSGAAAAAWIEITEAQVDRFVAAHAHEAQ